MFAGVLVFCLVGLALLSKRYPRQFRPVWVFLERFIGIHKPLENPNEPPFSFLIRDQSDANMGNGVEFDIRCKQETEFYMCWGVETALVSQLVSKGGSSQPHSQQLGRFLTHTLPTARVL
eukprot:sb/3476244/